MDPAKAFHSKSIIARFLIVFAGPAMNFVLAAVIFALVFMIMGRPALPPVIGRVAEAAPAAKVGVATGDQIAAVDGRPVKYWEDVLRAVQNGQGRAIEFTVSRAHGRRAQGDPHAGAAEGTGHLRGRVRGLGHRGRPLLPPIVGDVVSGFPAAQAGLQAGDTVVEIEGKPVLSWSDLAETISRRPGQPTKLVAKRGAERSPSR